MRTSEPHTRICRIMASTVSVLLGVLSLIVSQAAQAGEDEVTFTRTLSGAGYSTLQNEYIPGEAITIHIDIQKQGSSEVTAIGFIDLAPPGWTVSSVFTGSDKSAKTIQPVIQPEIGDSETLNFLWIDVPVLPFFIEYTLNIPTDQFEEVAFAGTCGYRFTAGALSFESTTFINGPPCIYFTRTSNAYVADDLLAVSIAIYHDGCTDSPLALGIEERIPAGWTLDSVAGPDTPAFSSPLDSEDILDFGWTTIPSSPVEFTYYLQVPLAEDDDPEYIDGEVLYHLDADLLQSATVETEIENGTPPPLDSELSVSPDPLFDFIVGIVMVDTTTSNTLSLTNIGEGTINGTAILNDPAGVFSITSGGTYSLGTSASSDMTINFSPTTIGDFTATLDLPGGANGTATITLKGTSVYMKSAWMTLLGCGPSTIPGPSPWSDLAILITALTLLLYRGVRCRRVR